MDKVEQVRQSIRPNTLYLHGERSAYLVSPLPFNTQRQGVVKLLRTIEWTVQPLQPVTSASDGEGIVWEVIDCQPPPEQIAHTKKGEVIIPWAGCYDEVRPSRRLWRLFKIAQDALDKIEQWLIAKIESQVKPSDDDELMPVVGDAERFGRLEQKFDQLAQKQINLEAWAQENNTSPAGKCERLQAVVDQQQQSMQGMFDQQM